MKKIFTCFLFMVVVMLGFTISANAKKYSLDGTDISILLDDTRWYVFTRDNIYNNPELDELGITYDYLYNFMHNNQIYLDAALLYEDDSNNLELIIRKKKIDKIKNLSDYSNDEAMKLAEELADKQNADIYYIYENDYKYIYLRYYEKGYNVVDYCTVINGESYTLTVQKSTTFTPDDLYEIERIVDTLVFDVNISLKQPSDEESESVWEKAIIGSIAAAIISGVGYFVNKNKTKEEQLEKNIEYNFEKAEASGKKNVLKQIGIMVISFVSSEMILLIILGDSVEGTKALLLTVLFAIPLYFLYNHLFKKKDRG